MRRDLPKIALAVALTAGLLFLFGRSVPWRNVPREMAAVNLPLFLLLVPGAAVHFLIRAARWRVLVAGEKPEVRYGSLVAATVVGFTVSALFPGRLGELVRPLDLARREKLRPGFAVGTVVIERIFDMSTMCLFLGLFLYFWPVADEARRELALWGRIGLATAAALLAGTLALALLRERAVRALAFILKPLPTKLRDRLLDLLREFIEGLRFFRSAGQVALYGLLSAAVWLGIILFYWAFLLAYDVRQPFALVVPYVFLIAVGASIPTPGMVGGFHYFSKLGLTLLLGVGPVRAAGLTLVAHALQIAVTCTLGYGILAREGLTLLQLRKMGEDGRR